MEKTSGETKLHRDVNEIKVIIKEEVKIVHHYPMVFSIVEVLGSQFLWNVPTLEKPLLYSFPMDFIKKMERDFNKNRRLIRTILFIVFVTHKVSFHRGESAK